MAIKEVKAILSAEDRGYTSTMKNAMGVTESFGSRIKSGLGFGALMGIGSKAVNVIAGAIKNNLGSAVKRLDTLNNFPKVMQSLGFSAENATKGIDKLANGITHLPSTLDSVAQQAQAIVPLTNNIDKATDIVLALNNAMAAGGADAAQQASAINQWTQAMSKGKPDMQDWKSIIQTAPAQIDQLAKSLLGANANQTDLYNAMQKGTISMDQVNNKMIELTNASGGFDIAGKHYDNFKTQAENASAGIGLAITNTKSAIVRNMANIIDALNQKIDISGNIKGIKPVIDSIGKSLSTAIGADSMTEGFTALMTSLGEKAQELIPKGMEMAGKFVEGIAAKAPELYTRGRMMILDFMIGIAQGLPKLLVSALNAVTTFLNGVTQGQPAVTGKAVTLIVTLVKGIIASLPKILMAALRLIVAFAGALIAAIPRLVQAAGQIARELGSALMNRLYPIINKVKAWVMRIPPTIKSAAGSLVNVGRDLIAGLWNGINAKFDSVIASVKAKAAALPKAVKKVLGIASPSKVMKKLGYWTGEGFAVGIESAYSNVQQAMGGIYNLQPAGALGGSLNASMSDDYMYNVSARYEVVVPVTLNGREIARASANDMQAALNQIESREARKVGIR